MRVIYQGQRCCEIWAFELWNGCIETSGIELWKNRRTWLTTGKWVGQTFLKLWTLFKHEKINSVTGYSFSLAGTRSFQHHKLFGNLFFLNYPLNYRVSLRHSSNILLRVSRPFQTVRSYRFLLTIVSLPNDKFAERLEHPDTVISWTIHLIDTHNLKNPSGQSNFISVAQRCARHPNTLYSSFIIFLILERGIFS